jgi:hypothetical protein
MKRKTFILSLLAITAGTNNNLFAQKEDKTYNETVVVTSKFNPIVSEARKIDANGITIDTDLEKETPNLVPVEKPFAPVMIIEQIKPAKVKGEPIEMLYNTHIAAGIGTYLTPYLDITHSVTRSRDFVWSLHARHLSSLWGGIKNVAHSTFAENTINAYAKKIWDKCFIDGNVSYSYDRNYWYGFNEDTIGFDIDKKDYRASYQNIAARLNYGSLFRDDNLINHTARIEFGHTSSKYGISETGLIVGATANRHFFFWDSQKPQTIGLNIDYKLKLYNDDFSLTPYFGGNPSNVTLNIDNGKLTINPYFDFSLPQIEDLAIHIGGFVIPTWESGKSKTFVLPQIWASYPVFKDLLKVKAGVVGALLRRSLNGTRLENPYISPFIQLKGDKQITAFITLNSNPLPSLTMSLEGGIDWFSNHGFFHLDAAAGLNNMFILAYDKGNRYYAKFQLAYAATKDFNLSFDAQVQKFDLENMAEAWYCPAFVSHFAIEYVLNKKLRLQFTPSFFAMDKAMDENGNIVSLNPRINLNLAAQYDLNNELSFFVNLYNLAFQRQEQYIHYPSQRFVGMIGAKIAF